MEDIKITRGGPGRGQGRKPATKDGAMVPVTVKLTEPQKTKLALLGGGEWVRNRIKRARLPKE